MFWVPPATTRSWVPDRTPWAAKCTACCEEPHWRSMVTPGTSSGSPAASQAGPGDVAGLRPDRVEAAEDDVLDGGRVDAGALDQGLQDMRAEVGRVDGRQASLAPPDGGADRFDDVGLGHDGCSSVSSGGVRCRTAIPSSTIDRYWRAISSGLCCPPGRYQDAATHTVSRTNR